MVTRQALQVSLLATTVSCCGLLAHAQRTVESVAEVSPMLRPLARPSTPVEPFANGFEIDGPQTVVMLGGTNAFESGRSGFLETLLTAAYSEQKLRFRNLAWQADTVFRQQRPRNFFGTKKPDYGERDGRRPIVADIVFLWMGQSESLGSNQLEEFTAAYDDQVEQIAHFTNRIVLVTPVPMSNPLRLKIDIAKRRQSLAMYADAIRRIGRNRQLPIVDLARVFENESTAYSRNGLHLSSSGHWIAARAFADQLGFADRVATIRRDMTNGRLSPEAGETLRQSITMKNDFWFRFWRPTNWAFLYGNRQQTPSSRDHIDPKRRWFPQEIRKARQHLEVFEARIHEQAKAAEFRALEQ